MKVTLFIIIFEFFTFLPHTFEIIGNVINQRLLKPEALEISSRKLPNLSYLYNLKSHTMSKRAQLVHIIYAAASIAEEFLPMSHNSLKMTMFIDSFMSNSMLVHHPVLSDSTVLGKRG